MIGILASRKMEGWVKLIETLDVVRLDEGKDRVVWSLKVGSNFSTPSTFLKLMETARKITPSLTPFELVQIPQESK